VVEAALRAGEAEVEAEEVPEKAGMATALAAAAEEPASREPGPPSLVSLRFVSSGGVSNRESARVELE
jgi:hypothetical protein